jgi:hypothetical protein
VHTYNFTESMTTLSDRMVLLSDRRTCTHVPQIGGSADICLPSHPPSAPAASCSNGMPCSTAMRDGHTCKRNQSVMSNTVCLPLYNGAHHAYLHSAPKSQRHAKNSSVFVHCYAQASEERERLGCRAWSVGFGDELGGVCVCVCVCAGVGSGVNNHDATFIYPPPHTLAPQPTSCAGASEESKRKKKEV